VGTAGLSSSGSRWAACWRWRSARPATRPLRGRKDVVAEGPAAAAVAATAGAGPDGSAASARAGLDWRRGRKEPWAGLETGSGGEVAAWTWRTAASGSARPPS